MVSDGSTCVPTAWDHVEVNGDAGLERDALPPPSDAYGAHFYDASVRTYDPVEKVNDTRHVMLLPGDFPSNKIVLKVRTKKK